MCPTPLHSSDVKKLVEEQLSRGDSFANFHGITAENVRSFVVDPFPVRINPDDLETTPRQMWIVLQECPAPTEGYVVVYDPCHETWGVAEHVGRGDYVLVISTPSLAKAIDGM